MAKRLYVCDVIIGDEDSGGIRSAIQDAVIAQRGSAKAIIPSFPAGHPQQGLPMFSWCLAIADVPNHAALMALPGVDVLPDFSFDTKVSAMHAPTRTAMVAFLQQREIDTSFIAGADGFREVVRTLGQRLEPSFSENSFDPAG